MTLMWRQAYMKRWRATLPGLKSGKANDLNETLYKEEQIMAENTENGSANTKIGEGFGRIVGKNQKTSVKNQTDPRSPRSTRFYDSKWKQIEKDAGARGMTAAELVRHAAMGFSAGRISNKYWAYNP